MLMAVEKIRFVNVNVYIIGKHPFLHFFTAYHTRALTCMTGTEVKFNLHDEYGSSSYSILNSTSTFVSIPVFPLPILLLLLLNSFLSLLTCFPLFFPYLIFIPSPFLPPTQTRPSSFLPLSLYLRLLPPARRPEQTFKWPREALMKLDLVCRAGDFGSHYQTLTPLRPDNHPPRNV